MARLLFSILLASAASASVTTWGQCGGIGYSGDTGCVGGTICTTWNPYYAQCVPGMSTASPTSTLATTSQPFTSPGPTSTTSTTTHPTQTASHGAAYFITFGDSYSQTGFDYTGTKPSAQNPLGNPQLPGWTASGGLNWVGFMATEFNTTLRLSYNFAYGGATVDADLVTPYTSTVKSLVDQVSDFSAELASHPSYAPWTTQDTVVGVWMGVNDVGNSYWLENEDELLEQIMARYFEQMQIIYDAGARKFVFLTVPPIYKTPLMLGQTDWSRQTEEAVIESFNSLLARHLAEFKTSNAGVVAATVDTSIPFNKAINNPTKYGAPDATCYNSDGLSCLWFNDYHPGIAINELVAAAVFEAIRGF